MNDAPAAQPAPAAAPPASDPGEFGPSIVPAAKPPGPAPEQRTFEQQRFAQDQAAADKAAKPPTADKAPPADPDQPADANAKHRIGDLEVTQAELQEWMESKAAAELKKATLPASPTDYQPVLPENFELPSGIKDFTFDTADPLFVAAQSWAHGKQMSQGDFSEVLSLYASAKATEAAELNAAHFDQVQKMGANGPMRVSALETWFRGVVGDDKIAGAMKNMLVTADIVKGMEKIQARMTNQGAASFSQSHRTPPDGNSIPNIDKMSFAQQRYAQDQLLAARRGGR